MYVSNDHIVAATDRLYLRYARQLLARLFCVLRVICPRCVHRVPFNSKGHTTGLVKGRVACIYFHQGNG